MNYPACAKTPFKPAYRITLPGRDDGQIFLIQPSCPAPFFTHPNRRVSNLRKNSRKKKLAIILGTEGDGLAAETMADCDYTVKIPMSHGVDSLNVAAASAVAFWEFGK